MRLRAEIDLFILSSQFNVLKVETLLRTPSQFKLLLFAATLASMASDPETAQLMVDCPGDVPVHTLLILAEVEVTEVFERAGHVKVREEGEGSAGGHSLRAGPKHEVRHTAACRGAREEGEGRGAGAFAEHEGRKRAGNSVGVVQHIPWSF